MSGPVQTVYVSNGRGGTVTPIDTATNTPGLPIPIGRSAGLVVMAPDGRTVYVASDESIVVPIDTATGRAPRCPGDQSSTTIDCNIPESSGKGPAIYNF